VFYRVELRSSRQKRDFLLLALALAKAALPSEQFEGCMKKISFELPKYRLQLHLKLVKRRKPLVSEPLLPSKSLIKKKYRSGSWAGKIARHISTHRNARKALFTVFTTFIAIGTVLPGAQAKDSLTESNTVGTAQVVIEATNTLKTQKSLQYPVANIKVNQGFSYFHPGLDLGSEVGTPVKAIKKGAVTEAGYSPGGYGNTVLVDHGDGLTSRYAHLSRIEVSAGQEVTTDTEVGRVGSTGRSTGPHLHLEIRKNNIPLNPISVLPR
jgi:murein DD-endopeptidase MepM/ murein hydrolase activator NlpD